ncbi:leukocyte receptor cluster member 1-like protein [Cinnamomum micranthum f. kanehirae]|uniref:Leukocyte receptor cluster member 1-like protein n=1 Tax=Cinnamomum micranthum f. kanehirae TaxID=337451 RepID=A0A3S4PDC8_9MAGN|nr:leukocyte receptor cluster member 1-like protein [Cinnamomum micranthum f. kanehirae]
MGGHGGLNILPQKSWNVYNYENREKVRRDEEAAAKEEQLKQDQSRKRDAEFRLETLRQARGIHAPRPQSPSPDRDPNSNSNSNSKHINLFEGLKTFPFSGRPEDDVQEDGPKKQKRQRRNDAPAAKVVLPEDEKYRLGYGVAGKGVKAAVVPL